MTVDNAYQLWATVEYQPRAQTQRTVLGRLALYYGNDAHDERLGLVSSRKRYAPSVVAMR